MKFLCLAYLDRGLSPGPDVASRYGALTKAMVTAGVIVDSGQLAPSSDSKTIRITDGKTDIADGPVVDATSHPSAYFLIDCASLDDALQWAARIPAATYGAKRWKELFPTAEQHIVPGGNHYPMGDDPEAVAEWIRRWHAQHVLHAHDVEPSQY